MPFDGDHLYNLMPAIYRVRDDAQGGPLRELLSVIAEQVAVIEEDLDQLYDDQFIETCADWVVPYIGDLIGHRALYGVAPKVSSPRAEVANTVRYRRRRGTASMLEQLARDVTGWNARVVEFFRLLATTQHMQHVRPGEVALSGIREPGPLERLGTPFDGLAHGVDVRRIASQRGRYNIANIGIFLWRLRAYAVTDAPASPVGDGLRFRFSVLGNDTALFNRPVTEDDVTHLAEQPNVPLAISRRELGETLATYWGRDRSVWLGVDGQPVPDPTRPSETAEDRIVACALDDDPANPGAWRNMPVSGGKIAVDPVLGRIAFPAQVAAVQVVYMRGFSADMGGGEYDRAATFDDTFRADPATPRVLVALDQATVPPGPATLSDALNLLGSRSGIVEICDSGVYDLGRVTLAAGQRIELRGANDPLPRRPTLRLAGEMLVDGGAESELILNGLLVTGAQIRVAGSVRRLAIRHCTLVPGLALDAAGAPLAPNAPSVVVEPEPTNLVFSLELDHSITGPLRFPDQDAAAAVNGQAPTRCELSVNDSIVDAGGGARRAMRTPVLVSGSLRPFHRLASSKPALTVTIGGDGPHVAMLQTSPRSLDHAAARLQAAIRAAAPGPAWARTVVRVAGDRLVVVPGTAEPVTIAVRGTDTSAATLRLDAVGARNALALVGAALSSPPIVRAAAPEIELAIGGELATVDLPATPADLDAVREALETGIRTASSSSAYTGALVARVDDALAIVPGVDGVIPIAVATPGDPTTVHDLGLSTFPAIGGEPDGEGVGPWLTVERSTIVGPVYATELTLASNSIFVHELSAERRQEGCARFSYIPPGSKVPRRYECQPAEEFASERIQPSFTSLHYGDPGYGQLATTCPDEIRRGADDGSATGAFHDLYEPQRETNLRVRLDEYLRFGLEAGIFYAS